MITSNLDEQVRELLEQRRGEWPRIAAATGVSHSWMSQFVRRKTDNPRFATLKRLYAHMTAGTVAPEKTEA